VATVWRGTWFGDLTVMDSGGAGINGQRLRFWQGDGFDDGANEARMP
jgi:hypothetical protein